MTSPIPPVTCETRYERPVEVGGGIALCQYLEKHPGTDHSWRALALEDAEYVSKVRERQPDPVVEDECLSDVETFLDRLNEGAYDPYLEAILASGHARKRVLRNVTHPYGLRAVPKEGGT